MAGSGKRRFGFIGASVVAVAGVSWMTLSGGDDSADVATGGDGYLVSDARTDRARSARVARCAGQGAC